MEHARDQDLVFLAVEIDEMALAPCLVQGRFDEVGRTTEAASGGKLAEGQGKLRGITVGLLDSPPFGAE